MDFATVADIVDLVLDEVEVGDPRLGGSASTEGHHDELVRVVDS